MRRKVKFDVRPLLFLLFCTSPLAAFGGRSSLTDYSEEVERLANRGDYLGARAVTRKMMRLKLSAPVWREVRRSLHANPGVGWDLLRDWEKVSPWKGVPADVDRLLAEGVDQLRARKFEEAFSTFQASARIQRREMKDTGLTNTELYALNLHMMARALFGAGRYEDAFRVYNWIPATYSEFRKATFERMWAAFRARRISEAVGALASQHSSYLGPFLEPEAYLVQIYIYRKLCRTEDLKLTLKSVQAFRRALKEQKFELFNWLKSDLNLRTYAVILEQSEGASSDLVSDAERGRERERLTTYLARRFNRERDRLANELERVLAFSTLSFSAKSRELPKIVKLPPPQVLSKTGLESWPVDDGEDWLDELGKHVFNGETQCVPRSR